MLSPGRGKPGMFTLFETLALIFLVAILVAVLLATYLWLR